MKQREVTYWLTYVEITEKSSSYTLMVCKNIFPSCTSYLLWAMVIRLLIIFVHFKAKVVLSVEVIKRDVGKILIDKILHLGVTNRWTFPPRHIIRGHEVSNSRDVFPKKSKNVSNLSREVTAITNTPTNHWCYIYLKCNCWNKKSTIHKKFRAHELP